MHIDKYEKYWIYAVSLTLGIFASALIVGAVVFGVRPPSDGEFINPLEWEQTQFANPGVRHMGDNKYEVVMRAQMWSFTPDEVRVPVGSEVTFIVTSIDVTHGFLVERHNINFELVPGHISRASITFDDAGEFKIICHEYCGRQHHLMLGTVYVEEGDGTETALNNEE